MSHGSPIPQLRRSSVAKQLPHLAFATGIAGWIAWYCWDAWHANAAVENLILILPVSIIGLVLYVSVLIGSFQKLDPSVNEPLEKAKNSGPGMAIKIAGSMVLLSAFVVAGPFIGFDVASFAYLLLMMIFLGERRILALVLVPALFTVAVIYGFTSLLSTPLPVLILRGPFS